MKKFLSVMLLLFIGIQVLPQLPAYAAKDGNQILKIGLVFGDDALINANLLPDGTKGDSYKIGYFDSVTRSHVSLFTTTEKAITVLKDTVVYIDADEKYYDAKPTTFTSMVSPYHLQIDTPYSDIAAAQAGVREMTNLGYTAFPAYINGKYVVRFGTFESRNQAATSIYEISGKTGKKLMAVGGEPTTYAVTITGTNKKLFEFDHLDMPMGIMPASSSNQKTETWFKGYKYYGGFEYNRVSGGNLTVSSVVSETDYIKGVIPYEMSSSWPIDALKAQTLCAKSFAMIRMGEHEKQGFDVCNTTDCQVYYGTKSANSNTDRAVDELKGKYVLYKDRVAQTYYHASSGGHTENSENVWGNSLPYLRGVPDDYLKFVNPGTYGTWSKQVTLKELGDILIKKGYKVSELTDVYISEFTEFGNVKKLTFVDKNNGVFHFTGEKARTILGNDYTKSQRFNITKSGGVYIGGNEITAKISSFYAIGSNKEVKPIASEPVKIITKDGVTILPTGGATGYTISGSGGGHNLGMSQWGARGMAEQGKSYDEIITYYFTGVTIGEIK